MDSGRKQRRKSASPAATIQNKSPAPALAIKRSDTAPVTLRGWLYKQGSDGLQLWKKRWFVLSEYCLFYYKDSNEEKVLGSILLPSYTISPLCKDDGVYRKYAFKAEHAGMRTYFFAAETKDSMLQWMNNMSLASILQNENKLRPELLSRDMARQGLKGGSRQFSPHHPQFHPQLHHQQQQQRGGQGAGQHVVNHRQHQVSDQHLQGDQQHPPARQPLYANAPPKPRRLNTSRDYSPSPDNSPERLSHSNFSHESEMNHQTLEDLPQFRHRLPQERRTPEAYGRSRFDTSVTNAKYPTKDYEEVYNNTYEYNNDRQLAEEVAGYNRDYDRRQSLGNNRRMGQPQQHPQQHHNGQFNHHPRSVPAQAQKIPRPHSADFLEYERTHPVKYPTGPGPVKHEKSVKTQPQRPKSCIGEKLRPDDFWSEEAYAQKMRESALVVDQVGPGQSRSQPGPAASHHLHNNLNKTGNNFHNSTGDHHVPPPAFYQDKHTDLHLNPRPRSSVGQMHQFNGNNSYQEDQEVANSIFPPSYQHPPPHPQQQQQQLQQRMTPNVYRYPPQTHQIPHHASSGLGDYYNHHQQMMQNHMSHQLASPEQREQKMMQAQVPSHQNMSRVQVQMSQNQQLHNFNIQNRNFNVHPPHPSQQHQQTSPEYLQQVQNINLLQNQQFAAGYYNEHGTKIIAPPSIPQPLPRKQPNNQQSVQTPTTYQNIPTNSKSFSDPRPVSVCRIDIATPNRLSERFDNDKYDESQDFKRSASARLPKQKTRVNDYINNTLSGESDDSKKNGDAVGREESMKRLLNWKQRMLQSPLTRKSSRNASRTQTPTNSDSPVPSLNDDIRKKVLEELQFNNEPTQTPREKRLSRKGSSGSRSSRSRSSPRIAPSKSQLLSSDDEEYGVDRDPRQARKRNRSQQSRSRNSSKENKKSPNSKSEQSKLRSRSVSCISPSTSSDQQPEYINIASIKSNNFTSSPDKSDIDLSWTSKIKTSHTIGPDDWYRDDFDFDKSHPFLDDPMLLKQYAQILDMKYRDSSNEKIEEILIQNSLAHQADIELSMFDSKNSTNLDRTKKVLNTEESNRLSQPSPVSRQFDVTGGAGPVSIGRYPDSGYDTLQVDMMDGVLDKQQMCVDIDTESSRKSNDFIFNEYDKQFPQHHSSSHFSDFQLLNKGSETVLLSIEGHGDDLERNIRSSSRQREADKIIWHVGKSYKDIRDEKEAPPKNVVKERLKNFETGSDKNQAMDEANNKIHQNCATPTPDHGEAIMTRSRMSGMYQDFSESDEELSPNSKKLEHKRSVKDLLSDFEKKSKALQKEEKEHKGGIGSFLLKDTRDGGHRRVCSDTETMHFATSSDDDDDNFDASFQDKKLNSLKKKGENDQQLPTQNDANRINETDVDKFNNIQIDDRHGAVPREETYLAMTPAKSVSSLTNSSLRNHKSSLLSGARHNSITSLTSSHGSSQSITSQNLQRFSSDKNLGAMTPSEVLTHAAAASANHNRTPSQTLVMEHFHPEMTFSSQQFEEETYVDMNEDGTNIRGSKTRIKESILARQSYNDTLDDTLVDPTEHDSPRYCEIDETQKRDFDPAGRTGAAHYELLSNARSANPMQQQLQPHYEALYHEISENNHPPPPASPNAVSTPMKKRDPPPLRPIEGLPDILGNAPTNKGNSSSDADDESSKDFDAVETKNRQTITLDDSFRPASFYLSRCKTGGGKDCDDDSSDSDLVSPPPVPSSPPPMEEVLGFTSSSNFDCVNFAEGMNVFAAARSSSALRERSRLDSHADSPRRPSVGSKASFVSQHSVVNDSQQQQNINRDAAKSPPRLHGSHQSLSSRELPPIPNQNLQGSQQSLASKEIQQIGSRATNVSNENIFRNSPYHSREGSLDNEAFLFHKFTQGTSISDYYKRHGSDSAELSSSDTANYEQEYRRYHLENIQEVSNTLERSESGVSQGHHNTSIISQELNISYNSVYDSRLQNQGKEKSNEDQHLQQQKFFQPDPRSKEIEDEIEQQNINRANQAQSPRSKIPYYMSDIMEDGTIVQRQIPSHIKDRSNDQTSSSQEETPSLGVVDAITKSMNALDVESKSYFEEKNAKENERIKMLRRSYTPDPYFSKTGAKESNESRPGPSPASDSHFESNNVVRSKSLEGLLGDTQGGPKDNIGYAKQSTVVYDNINIPPPPAPRPPSSTAKRGPPPPPPVGVPPLDISPLSHNYEDEDEMWADSLRRASIRQRAKSVDHSEESSSSGRKSIPPPTAPKPKTPVHMFHQNNVVSYNGANTPVQQQTVPHHVTRNSAMIVHHHPQSQSNDFQFSGHGMRQQEMFMQEFPPQQPWPGPGHHQPVVVQRNSVVSRNENFLEAGLPSPTSSDQRRSVSRPTSRGPPGNLDWMGRQQTPGDGRSMTLPARIKYSQDSLPRDITDSFDSDNSPRTRTSKSGLHEDGGTVVPPSPAPNAQQNIIQNNFTDPSFGSHMNFSSHHQYRDGGEIQNQQNRRRRSSSLNRKSSADLEMLKKKFGGNLANITAGDLLNKSQEELVLILIQLRRQSASLCEAIDACKAEQDNTRNSGAQPSMELRQHTWELEEQLARVNPVINLVDNMVKLGTLYRGADNAPLSQRINEIQKSSPPKQSNEIISQHPRQVLGRVDQEFIDRQQDLLEKELARVQNQLKISHKALDENGSDMSRFEKDMNALSLEFHNSVQRDRSRGGPSRNTINIEADMRLVKQKTEDLLKMRNDMMQYIQNLRQQENYLIDEIDEIRKAPTGISGAEPLPQKNKQQNTWYETDIDNNYTKDRGPETELQILKENKNISKPGTMYINAMDDEPHNYENFDSYENFKNNLARNPYEDDVQTIHSEGVRSEMEGPPLPERPNKQNNDEMIIGLGDIGEADEKVQRFYGILPKEKPIEIKTVRMVKRDNKERSSKTRKGNSEEDSESVELSVDEEEQPPPPLPRGNYQNLHNFLSNKPYDSYTANNSSHNNNGADNKKTHPNTNNQVKNNNYLSRNTEQRPVFRLGEYSHRSTENLSRPGSSMSAHERLFGSSRDSLSPEVSPVKTGSLGSSDSSQSAIMSPVFKSAAARAIIEEERKTPMIIPKAKKKGKKRHMTITSSHPAVLEAISRHDAKMDLRSRDDMDIERTLKQPSDAPDLVQSTYGQNENTEFKTNALDNLFGVPEKINIPERYVPDQVEEASPEEKKTRLKKADSIRRMLADSSATPVVKRKESGEKEVNMNEDKRQREQILALNQVLAQQVLQKSRKVSGPRD